MITRIKLIIVIIIRDTSNFSKYGYLHTNYYYFITVIIRIYCILF